jgi:short-subunit dehydrogenase
MSKRQSIVLITGATSGIGRHAALYLAERGMRVFATGRRADKLAELNTAAADLDLETLVLDVTDADSIAAARETIHAATNGYGVDVLVNNAGYGEMGPIELMSDDRLRAQFDTNVFGLMAVTRAFLPAMRERGHGRIINVGSLGGTITLPLLGAYNATKYALESLTDAMRLELVPFGIKISLIQPGPINTEFTPSAMDTADSTGLAGTAYAAVAQSVAKMGEMAEKTGVSPRCTSRAIYRASTSRWPRARYATPWFASWGVALARMLPTSWRDAILRRSAGLTRRKLLAAGTAELLRAQSN